VTQREGRLQIRSKGKVRDEEERKRFLIKDKEKGIGKREKRKLGQIEGA
jgi:hypothetical protein